MNETEVQEVEQEIADLRERIIREFWRPAVSLAAEARRAVWADRARQEINRLERLLPSKAGASEGGESE